METLILASSSPRRVEMLTRLGIPFVKRDPEVDESLRDDLPPKLRVVALAEDKARAVAGQLADGEPRLVLGADTLVCLPAKDGAELVLGKPEGREGARLMLGALAGREHIVHTGLALIDRCEGRILRSRSDSVVSFSPMSGEEIELCLDSGEWEGVAGSYRLQGIAALFIERIEGSWTGIVGLPLRELYGILREANFRFRPIEGG
jgi:septum formation protein